MKSDSTNSDLPEDVQKQLKDLLEYSVESLQAGNTEQAEAAGFSMLEAINEHFEKHPPKPDPVFAPIQAKEDAWEWAEALALRRQAMAELGSKASLPQLYKWWERISRLDRYLGQPLEALAAAQAAVAAAQRIPDLWVLTTIALALESECALDARQPQHALNRIEAALAMFEPGKIYDRNRAELHVLRAAAKVQLGDLSGAEAEIDDITPLMASVQADSLMNLGQQTAVKFLAVQAALHAVRGECAEAVEIRTKAAEFWRTGFAMNRIVRIGWELAMALRHLAQALEAAGSPTEAADARKESDTVFRELHLPPPPADR